MILRRITKHVKDQNWFAVFLDFFIVVAGILIAFQITNWNEERADRAAERESIERLVVEYNQNLAVLAENKSQTQRTMRASAKLKSMIAPEPDLNITDESVAQTLSDGLTNPRFIPNLGATNSLLASGDLDLIQDAKIQSQLSKWQTDFQALAEWQEIERMHGEELILGLTYEYLAWPSIAQHVDGTGTGSKLESDYSGLFSSKRFEGLLYNRWYNSRSDVKRITELEASTRELIDALETRLKELK